MAEPTKVDILIIGAGPAGLVCANALVKLGVKVKIVDHQSERTVGHGEGVMSRTTEIIHSYGLGTDLMKQGFPVHSIASYKEREDGGGIERADKHVPFINEDDTRWPYAVALHQGAIEKLFIRSMAEDGLIVDRPVRPVSVQISDEPAVLRDPTAYPIVVCLEKLGSKEKQEEVHAKFLLGGDGAHSWVRKQLGFTMEGDTTSRIWGAVDFKPDQVPDIFPDWRHISTVTAKDHTILMVPRAQDKLRLYIELGETEVADGHIGRVEVPKVGPEDLLKFAQKAFTPYSITTSNLDTVEWCTNYIIGQRVATQFSLGDRAFIAGDACHTHSPKGGQGMNVSMNDSHNLAWKLYLFLNGWADYSILGTYEHERRPVAQAIIAFDKWYTEGWSAKARAEIFKDTPAPATPFEGFRQASALTSGIGIVYTPSIVVSQASPNSAAPNLVLGQRIPPRVLTQAANCHPVNLHDMCPSDGRFRILVFTGDLTNAKQAERLAITANALAGPQGILRVYRGFDKVFDIMSIVKGQGPDSKTSYQIVPQELRSHWSKVLVDEHNICDAKSNICYDSFGISPTNGAIVAVRPDIHVGAVVHLEDVEGLEKYFSGFLLKQQNRDE